ncbi:MAG: protein-glutamate O-methyltransferase CheR, partial [Bdellovibrionales bacterium]|nr:protein-glutamate O-methyltransferase CheR [Bdellovibrionales bacterium]
TSFFRDNHPFEALAHQVVPEIIKNKGPIKSIEIWSAASSMGQEPYSILMTLFDDCPQLSGWNFNLRATDISAEALRRTKEGLYTKLEVQRGLPIKKMIKFFDKIDDNNYKFKKEYKGNLKVEKFNLFEDKIIPNSYDIIFIRNVLIYQNVENKQKILNNIFLALRPGGYMFLGNGESLIGIEHQFKLVNFGSCTVFTKPSESTIQKAS